MAQVSMQETIDQLLAVLQEGFEGPPGKWSYFTDNNPDAGLFGTLTKVDAAEASKDTGGSTIAGHVNHLIFSLTVSTAWIRGERSPQNWKESWRIQAATHEEWPVMLDKLREEYQNLRETVASHAIDDIQAMGASIGAAAHAAYHLGTIRQIMKLRKDTE